MRAVGGLGTIAAWLLGLVLLFGSWLSAPAMPDPGSRVATLAIGLLAAAILASGLWWSMRAAASNLVWALGPWVTLVALAVVTQQVYLDA